MTKFSDAELFGMTIRESATDGSDFTNPSADYRRLFLGEDGNLHLKDSAGAVTDIGGGATFDADYLPWVHTIIPMIHTPSASTGAWTLVNYRDNLTTAFVESLTTQGFGALQSSGAQNDALTWPLVLAAGTWAVRLLYRKSTNTGIVTVNMDGSSQGTIDTYAGAVAFGDSSITGISVASTGKKDIQLKMATKNASSASYYGEIVAMTWLRTA